MTKSTEMCVHALFCLMIDNISQLINNSLHGYLFAVLLISTGMPWHSRLKGHFLIGANLVSKTVTSIADDYVLK